MTWHALYYPLRSGSEQVVKDLFRAGGRPDFDVSDQDGKPVGRLLGTMAFVGERTAVRVMEVQGPLPVIAAHMSRQPQVRAFEQQLENHLAAPRDMRSPDGARRFFRHAGMAEVVNRIGTDPAGTAWQGAFFLLAAGAEDKARAVLAQHAAGAPHPTVLAFVGEGKALYAAAVADGSPAPADGFADLQAALGELSADPVAGAAAATDPLVECVINRRHDRDL